MTDVESSGTQTTCSNFSNQIDLSIFEGCLKYLGLVPTFKATINDISNAMMTSHERIVELGRNNTAHKILSIHYTYGL